MSLTAGTRLGPYEVVAPIGAGGMGEVYRARDTKLNRDVALKILPDLFATDVDRLARFKREAQVLASLNHPNIGHIYGFEDSGAAHALVLELIEGPTLADRIAQGPISLDEALPIARQIAEALEAAHEHGIVHRDLKPANVKVKDDGAVKVLDFGLAKAIDPTVSRSSDAALNSPTLTAPTQMGVILGTAAYMAPEQAKGKTVDRRADIWAFGAVLYEMLTGTRAFQGDDVSDTLAAVLRQEVNWSALPASTPAAVRRLLARCLERDVKRRLRDIGEARIVLDEPATREDTSASTTTAAVAPPTASPRPLWRRALPVVGAAIVAATLGAASVSYLQPAPLRAVTRFPIVFPEGTVFSGGRHHILDISPDGSRIVIAADNRLYLRSMSDLALVSIPGSDAFSTAIEPRFSPDGESIVFWAVADRTLKRIAVAGGATVTICPSDVPLGMSWEQDAILFGSGKGIMRVSASGGKPETIITTKSDEVAHGPQMLPDGQHVLYTLASGTGTDRWDKARIVVQRLSSGEPKVIVDGGSDARYVPTGHLVYAISGTLFAVPFDVRTLEATRGPAPVLEGVSRSTAGATGSAQFSVSSAGSLIYRVGPASFSSDAITLGFSDKKGIAEPLSLRPGPHDVPRISPDGKRIALQTTDAKESIIWIFDVAGNTALRRLTFGGSNRFPVWSGDGKYVTFQSDREGDLAIFRQPADGTTTTAERLTKPNQGEAHIPQAWSPNSGTLLFDVAKGTDIALWMLTLPDRKAMPFGQVQSTLPTSAIFSPDGRWVAYVAPATTSTSFSGVTIFVEPFPRTEAKFQLLARTGESPHEMTWSPDGKEIYYNPRPGGFEAVTVTTTPTFAFGNPVAVPRQFALGPPNARRLYDIAPDGRFLGLFRGGQDATIAAAYQELRVVLNWFEELKARVPVK